MGCDMKSIADGCRYGDCGTDCIDCGGPKFTKNSKACKKPARYTGQKKGPHKNAVTWLNIFLSLLRFAWGGRGVEQIRQSGSRVLLTLLRVGCVLWRDCLFSVIFLTV